MEDTPEVTTKPAVAVKPAPTKEAADILKSPDFLLLVAAFVGLLFLAALAIWFLDRWRKKQDRGQSPAMTLSNYRALYEAGELSQEEYERIRLKMAGAIKSEMGVDASPPVPPPAPPKSE